MTSYKLAAHPVIIEGVRKQAEAHRVKVTFSTVDVSVMGFGGIMAASFCTPPLSTMYVPKAEMGQLALAKLLDRMAGNTEMTCTTLVEASLASRESVRQLV